MGVPYLEATTPMPDRAAVLVGYLDYLRATVLAKVGGLSEDQLRASVLPSGWSPLELVHHLTWVERRWLLWGFEGRPYADPWADRDGDRWRVPESLAARAVLAGLADQGAATARVAAAHDLAESGAPGDRWEGADPPTLERVLLHLVQEYARHVGHLDVVRELIDGATGE